MFPAAAAQAKPPRSRVLQLLKCATCQNPTGSPLSSTRQNGLQRPMTPGGVTAAGNQPRDRWGASSGYEASGTHTDLDEIPVDRARLPRPDAPALGAAICAAVTNRRLEATPGAPSGAHSGLVLTDYAGAGSKRLRPLRSRSVPHAQSELKSRLWLEHRSCSTFGPKGPITSGGYCLGRSARL